MREPPSGVIVGNQSPAPQLCDDPIAPSGARLTGIDPPQGLSAFGCGGPRVHQLRELGTGGNPLFHKGKTPERPGLQSTLWGLSEGFGAPSGSLDVVGATPNIWEKTTRSAPRIKEKDCFFRRMSHCPVVPRNESRPARHLAGLPSAGKPWNTTALREALSPSPLDSRQQTD